MMSSHVIIHRSTSPNVRPRYLLLCPVRGCQISMRDCIIQDHWQDHIKDCLRDEKLVCPRMDDVITCPLGHVTNRVHYGVHAVCHYLAKEKFNNAPLLKYIVSKYTVIPCGVFDDDKFLSVLDINQLVLNFHSTPAATQYVQNRFHYLVKYHINKHLESQNLCKGCLQNTTEGSFPPLQPLNLTPSFPVLRLTNGVVTLHYDQGSDQTNDHTHGHTTQNDTHFRTQQYVANINNHHACVADYTSAVHPDGLNQAEHDKRPVPFSEKASAAPSHISVPSLYPNLTDHPETSTCPHPETSPCPSEETSSSSKRKILKPSKNKPARSLT